MQPAGIQKWTFLLSVMAAALIAPAASLAQEGVVEPSRQAAAAQGAAGQAPSGQAAQAQKPVEGQAPGEAQQPPRVDVEVLVAAPRLDIPLKDNPAATTVLTSATLESMPRGVAAEEALALVPGLKVDNQADGERVHLSIRGQGLLTERGIRGVKVLLDGLPLNDPTGFAPDLFDVDWSAVKTVEVLRGPVSALYGGGSSGGIINITTRDGGDRPAAGQVWFGGGSYGFLKGFAEAGGTVGGLNYRVSASGNTGDGYRLHTNFDATNLYGKFRYRAGERTTLTAILAGTRYYNDNAEGLNLAWENLGQGVEWRRQANPDALTFNEYQRTRRITAGLSGRTVLDGDRALNYAVYYRNTAWKEAVPSSVQHRAYDSPGVSLQYTQKLEAGPFTHHVSAGGDLDWQAIDDSRYANLGLAREGNDRLSDQSIAQRGVGLFVLDRIDLSPTWSAMAGVRADWIHNQLDDKLKAGGVDLSGTADFSKVTGRVGVAWNPRPEAGVYASWGQGFMPPATEELANNPDGLGGFNTNLEPATSAGEEVGLRGGSRGVAYDVAFFHLRTRNDFGRYRVPERPLETFYGNLGESRRYGLETSVGYFGIPGLAAQVAYTYSDFTYDQVVSLFGSFKGTVMPNAPRHQLGLDVEYTWRSHWVAGVNVYAQSLQYIDQSNETWADGFALLNPRLAFRWSSGGYDGEVFLAARNLTGTEYIAFTEPDPDGNSYQPGPTREVFAGVRLKLGR